jgi:hypothetical protein
MDLEELDEITWLNDVLHIPDIKVRLRVNPSYRLQIIVNESSNDRFHTLLAGAKFQVDLDQRI